MACQRGPQVGDTGSRTLTFCWLPKRDPNSRVGGYVLQARPVWRPRLKLRPQQRSTASSKRRPNRSVMSGRSCPLEAENIETQLGSLALTLLKLELAAFTVSAAAINAGTGRIAAFITFGSTALGHRIPQLANRFTFPSNPLAENKWVTVDRLAQFRLSSRLKRFSKSVWVSDKTKSAEVTFYRDNSLWIRISEDFVSLRKHCEALPPARGTTPHYLL